MSKLKNVPRGIHHQIHEAKPIPMKGKNDDSTIIDKGFNNPPSILDKTKKLIRKEETGIK